MQTLIKFCSCGCTSAIFLFMIIGGIFTAIEKEKSEKIRIQVVNDSWTSKVVIKKDKPKVIIKKDKPKIVVIRVDSNQDVKREMHLVKKYLKKCIKLANQIQRTVRIRTELQIKPKTYKEIMIRLEKTLEENKTYEFLEDKLVSLENELDSTSLKTHIFRDTFGYLITIIRQYKHYRMMGDTEMVLSTKKDIKERIKYVKKQLKEAKNYCPIKERNRLETVNALWNK